MIKIKSKKTLIITSIILLTGLGSGYYLLQKDSGSKKPTQPTGTLEGNINFDPPTNADKQAVDQNKQRLVKRDQKIENNSSAGQTSATKKSVKPIITYAGQYGSQIEVGGYIPGVYEDGGLCQATFSRGGSSFSKTVQAVKGANSVDCPAIEAAVGEFAQKGIWSVVLSYESSLASGASDSRQVEVK